MERERDPATIELLKNLKSKVLSENISAARVAAFNLSWLQEDGLAVLKEIVLGEYSKIAKKAAAYGLRNMRGRMKKMAAEVLEQGKQSQDPITREACEKSLFLMHNKHLTKPKPKKKTSKRQIKDIPPKGNARVKTGFGNQRRGYNNAQPTSNENALPFRSMTQRRPNGNFKPPRKPNF